MSNWWPTILKNVLRKLIMGIGISLAMTLLEQGCNILDKVKVNSPSLSSNAPNWMVK